MAERRCKEMSSEDLDRMQDRLNEFIVEKFDDDDDSNRRGSSRLAAKQKKFHLLNSGEKNSAKIRNSKSRGEMAAAEGGQTERRGGGNGG